MQTAAKTSVLTAAAAGTAVAVLVVALEFGGGVDGTALPGIPGPGTLTVWALPALTMLATVLGVLTVGLTVTAAFLLPGDGPSVAAHGWVLLRRSTWLALPWAVTSLLLVVVTVSDVLGVPVAQLSRASVTSFAFSINQGQALLLQAGLALLVVVLTRGGVSRGLAAGTAGVALVALLPPAFTGHAAGAGNHQIAVTSLALHIVAASLWLGGLASLLLVRRHRRFAATAARYSRLALACFAATAVSGTVNAAVRLGDWSALTGSRYGVLVLLKVLALLVVGALGAAHRSRSLPALRSGAPWAFLRLAAGELVVLGAAAGLAVALSRSPTPVPEVVVEPDPLVELLGFDQPGPVTVLRLVTGPLPDLVFVPVVGAGILAYLAGVRRLHRAGHAWPARRTASWLGGMLVLGAITGLGVARYAYVLISAHVVQHLVLSTVVPVLLAGGVPVRLALRALRRPADPQVRGAREWLLVALRSRSGRFLHHPLTALAGYGAGLGGLYVTGLLGPLMRYHLGHLAMLAFFLVTGYLFVGSVARVRRRWVLVVLLLLVAAAHAYLGWVLRSGPVVATGWFTAVHPAWSPSLAADQRLAAVAVWASGLVPAAVLGALLSRRRKPRRAGNSGAQDRDQASEDPDKERTSCESP